MGLFNFFKKKTTVSEDHLEKDVLKSLAKFSRENGDYNMAFYYEHKAVIDLYEHQITDQLVLSRNTDDAGNTIQYLLSAKAIFESMQEYCLAHPGGKEYYEYRIQLGPDKLNRVERLEKQIKDAEYIYHVVVPTILERADQEGGVKQADLSRAFDVGREIVLAEIRRLELNGSIRTEKRGKYVFLFKR